MQLHCAVKNGEAESEGCLIGIKSERLIRIVALRTWILVSGGGKARLGILVPNNFSMESIATGLQGHTAYA